MSRAAERAAVSVGGVHAQHDTTPIWLRRASCAARFVLRGAGPARGLRIRRGVLRG